MAEIAGLTLITPSSVAGSGVSVSASGKVTFTAATSVSVNGVFSATHDNYLVVVRGSVQHLAAPLRIVGESAARMQPEQITHDNILKPKELM